VALAVVDAFPKFNDRGFIPKTITLPRPRPFQGGIFTLGVGLAVVDPFAKFNEHSFIHSRNIEGV